MVLVPVAGRQEGLFSAFGLIALGLCSATAVLNRGKDSQYFCIVVFGHTRHSHRDRPCIIISTSSETNRMHKDISSRVQYSQ